MAQTTQVDFISRVLVIQLCIKEESTRHHFLTNPAVVTKENHAAESSLDSFSFNF